MPLQGKNAFITSAMDRYGMASALYESGCKLKIGDLAFALGIPIFFGSLSTLKVLAAVLMPVLSHLPIQVLYPTGKSQEQVVPKFPPYTNGRISSEAIAISSRGTCQTIFRGKLS